MPGTSRPAYSTSDFSQTVCRSGVEFWSTEKVLCLPCTVCEPKFTLSPCAVHQDAICGPLSALELDWSFLTTGNTPESKITHITSNEELTMDSQVIWTLKNKNTKINWLICSDQFLFYVNDWIFRVFYLICRFNIANF